ncbi:FACT complex subunit spt16-like [Ochlerotatus camptorhynchus]|uniref:FACT complex subunit spt16-like n=1 Tax=Ochlerotatus camptorhynchus TaxID=644619 RepID=UPI0031D63C5A
MVPVMFEIGHFPRGTQNLLQSNHGKLRTCKIYHRPGCDTSWPIRFFLISNKKIDFLKQIEKDGEEGIPSVKLLVRDKNDKDKANFDKLLEAIKGSKDGKTLGVFSKDNFPGEFCESWRAFVKDKSFDRMDISVPIGYIMCSKKDSEVVTIKKACLVTYRKHATLSEGVEQALTDKSLQFSAFSVKNYLHFVRTLLVHPTETISIWKRNC